MGVNAAFTHGLSTVTHCSHKKVIIIIKRSSYVVTTLINKK